MSAVPRFRRFVALGDSTTEGLEDPHPDGGLRGWADRLAEQLALENPNLGYANLAIRGRKLAQIRAEQLKPALELEPDLASLLGGVNDVLRRGVDLDARAADLDVMAASLRAGGAEVLLFTYPDMTQTISIAAGRIRERIDELNRRIREIATARGARLVDLEHNEIRHPAFWAPDRLHAGPLGHERIAAVAADALGLEPEQKDWEGMLGPAPVTSRPLRAASDLAWAGRHLAPWVVRRLRGVSSGDGREPKRPKLARVVPIER